MNAPLYLYHVKLANGVAIIIAAVNLQAALDSAKPELRKYHTGRRSTDDLNLMLGSPTVSVKEIHSGTVFAVAGGDQ